MPTGSGRTGVEHAAAVPDQPGHGMARAEKITAHVDGHHVLVIVHVDRDGIGVAHRPRAVERVDVEPVDAACAARGGIDEGFHAGLVADIDHDRFGLAARADDLPDGLFRGGPVDVTDRDKGALPGQPFGHGRADPARAAGNRDGLAVEAAQGGHVHLSSAAIIARARPSRFRSSRRLPSCSTNRHRSAGLHR
jgi:hypothetical protein